MFLQWGTLSSFWSAREKMSEDMIDQSNCRIPCHSMTTSFTCVGVLWRTRYITIVAILIQWDANKWQGILQLTGLIIAIIHTIFMQLWNLSLNRIQTHDLCNTSVVLYQGSYLAYWELVTLWVRNIPVHSEEKKWIYERPHYIWTAAKNTKILYAWSLQWCNDHCNAQSHRYIFHCSSNNYMVFHVFTCKDV